MNPYIIRVNEHDLVDPETLFTTATMYSPEVVKEANMTTPIQMNLKSPEAIDRTTQAEARSMFPSKRSIRNVQRAVAKNTLQTLTQAHELQFVHIRNYKDTPFVGTSTQPIDLKGGMTIAYRVVNRGNTIEMSTALCSPKDVYDKVLGKAKAAEDFDAGARVRIKLPSKKYGQDLKFIFGFCG